METSPLQRMAPAYLATPGRAVRNLAVIDSSATPPVDEVSLSASSEPPRRNAPRLANLAYVGLSLLGIVGGLAANASAAAHAPDQVQVTPARASESLSPKLTDMVTASTHPEGWLLSSPSPAPADTLQLKPLRVATVQKGDYVRHGVNFSNLVSNAEFTDTASTRQADVQAYLEDIGSWLANTPVDGQRGAAEVIMTTAKTHQINPWVLLATLEKETSLVTRTTPPSHHTLRKSMGFAYNDGGSKAGKKSNFLYQLDKGAELLKKLYDEGQELSFPHSMKVNYGKKTIIVRNAATYALTRYTPHTVDTRLKQVGGGNFLFRKHMERMVNTFLQNNPPVQDTRLAAD